jgi:hypothetical protein
MKQIYCLGCHQWIDGKLTVCDCGWVRPGFNKSLRTAQLNNHLYGQVESANREKKIEQQMMGGG